MKFVWENHILKQKLIGIDYGKDPSKDWKQVIPIEDRPIQYLEIGVLHGRNVIKVENSYCKHQNSKITCIDPWFDYNGYSEYKSQQDNSWVIFNKNIESANIRNKLTIYRNLSENVVPALPDNFYDIIFVDGNHETEYVYRDGVMCFDKLKSGGHMIFDDYSFYGPSWPETKIGIDKFLEEYKHNIQILSDKNSFLQCIIRKV